MHTRARTRSGGCQPAVVREPHLQSCYRNCSEDCSRRVGPRYCNRVAVTTGGLRPPLFVGVTVAGHAMSIPRASLACSTRGVTPPALVSRAFAGRWNCDFCDAQTYMHRRGGRDPAVASGTAPATTIPHTFGHGRRTRTKSGGREPAVASGTAPATTIPHTFGHGRRTRTRSGGCKPAVADGQRTCKGASAIARQTAAGVLAHAVAIALPQPRGLTPSPRVGRR